MIAWIHIILHLVVYIHFNNTEKLIRIQLINISVPFTAIVVVWKRASEQFIVWHLTVMQTVVRIDFVF